jgi:hypothetical protein
MRGATVVSKSSLSRLADFIIDNSDTLVIGDLVTVNSDGHVTLVTNADEPIAGVVVEFVGYQGEHIEFDSGTTDRITVASDNETVGYKKARVDTGTEIEIDIDADDTLSTTNLLQYFNTNNSYQVDVADASDTDGALQLLEIDPEGVGDLSMGRYRIADHQKGRTAS